MPQAPTPSKWQDAQWIGGGSQLRTDILLPTGAVLARARAYVTGVGAMELHINGGKVGDHILDPGEAVYDQRILFVTHDVTALLKPGSNAVGALLGNSKFGYLDLYANRTLANDQSGDSTRAFKMVLTVEMSAPVKKTLTFATMADGWYYRHGPIVYDHLWHGEIYDSRQETKGHAWCAAPMSQYSRGTWALVKPMLPKAGVLSPQRMPGVRITRTFQPTSISKKNLGTSILFDFGQNMAGFTTLTFDPALAAAALASALARSSGSRGNATGSATKAIKLVMRHTEIAGADGNGCGNHWL